MAIFFFPEPINFSASEGPGVEFPDARNCPEKTLKIGKDTQTFLFLIFLKF